MSSGSALGARWLLLLALLAVTVALAASTTTKIDCRRYVYHAKCRGVQGRNGRSRLTGLGGGRNADLIRLVTTYLSDQSETRKLRALEHYLSPKRSSPVSDKRAASLLDRLLTMGSDDSDDYDVDV